MTELLSSKTNWYILDLNPEPWEVGPVAVGRRNGRLSATVAPSIQLQSYQQAVRESIENPVLLTGNVSLVFYFWRQLPTFKTQRINADGEDVLHQKHWADVTNMQKALEDALQGVLYPNDRKVWDIHSILMGQSPSVEPCIVIGATDTKTMLQVFGKFPSEEIKKMRSLQPKVDTATVVKTASVEDVF